MSALKNEYLLSKYVELSVLGKRGDLVTSLVKCSQTGQLFVKKVVTSDQAAIYKALKNSPHKNLAHIIEIIEADDACFIIEEYISGKNLNNLLEEYGTLEESEVCHYAIQLCSALEHIHKNRIIHRDIQPKNVIISTDHIVHLIDFDISRTPSSEKNVDTTLMGTAGYASPEQFGFSQTDYRSDIYSVGVLMNVLLTGNLPPHERYQKQPLANVIKKCLQVDVKNRYPNAAALKKAIEAAANGKQKLPDPQSASVQAKEDIQTKEHKPLKQTRSTPSGSKYLKNIPGFRTNQLWKKIMAVLVYIYGCINIIGDLIKYAGYGLYIYTMAIASISFLYLIPFFLVSNLFYFDRKIWPFKQLKPKMALGLRLLLTVLCLLLSRFILSGIQNAIAALPVY